LHLGNVLSPVSLFKQFFNDFRTRGVLVMNNSPAAVSALKGFLNCAVGVLVKINAVLHYFAYIVGSLVNKDIYRVGVVFTAAGNHCVLIVEVEAVVFKAQNSRNAALSQITVRERVRFL